MKIPVKNPYNGSVVGEVVGSSREDVDGEIERLRKGQERYGKLSSYKRYEILKKTADIILERGEKFAETIALESGKTMGEAKGEVDRATQTILLSGEEAKRIKGETIPYDSIPSGEGRRGFFIRVPVGLVGAITPFNFPLNLVAHKVGPALAAGNAVILKPSTKTPLTAMLLRESLVEAGLPPDVLSVVVGSGGEIGEYIVSHGDIRVISFTGSLAVAERITRVAGMKRLLLEAGSNSACVVMGDADMEMAAERIVKGGYALAGQVCISVQRVFVEEDAMDEFLAVFIPKVKRLRMGDQMDGDTDVGPMITKEARERVLSWIEEAKKDGAEVLCGGNPIGDTLLEPAVIAAADESSKVMSEELFGPVVVVNKFSGIDDAICKVNRTKYGLQAGIFTNDLDVAMRAIEGFEVGGVVVGDVPTYRADPMPYGGVKKSGIGREGPKFAVEEYTEIKAVVFTSVH
ncbi:aldehyde dehydrogenase [candidate division WOR-3 bacterium JGI_Cruoil_03_44_89]|uniref:Aldehyde dehydrogenase n=1 Tax=candidate division WOR-3 bacterium JGI_Cruoil_03_44_89 TaxID=1973748 RepID=A0A235BUP2_UNCW3|nr:MAG: aldehyde dehydrogenase [candidate division WOR-3 bacterium JGI_Cruoil_03_44_89]